MALSSSSTCIRLNTISCPYNKIPVNSHSLKTVLIYFDEKFPFRVSAGISSPKARFVARRKESVSVRQLQRPLIEYMSLPASQYSVLDAERIERVDDNTFRCYVYRFKFFTFEICPVLLVRVEEQPNGCCIKLLSCKLEGSPIVAAQNDKFDATMVNQISCDSKNSNSEVQQLTSDAFIEVGIEIPFAFRAFPVEAMESTGTHVLDQILRLMLPRFMAQLVKIIKHGLQGIPPGSPLELERFEYAKNVIYYRCIESVTFFNQVTAYWYCNIGSQNPLFSRKSILSIPSIGVVGEQINYS